MAYVVRYLSSATYNSIDDRSHLGGLIAQDGVINESDLAVTFSSGMQSSVAVGRGLVSDGQATGGLYDVRSTTAVLLTHGTAPGAGESRYDLIVLRVYEHIIDASNRNEGILEIVPGVAATTGTQTEPAVPAKSIQLSRVLIPPSVVNLSTATYLNRRNRAVTFGMPPTGTTTNKPASAPEGAIYRDLTLDRYEYYNGSAWVVLAPGMKPFTGTTSAGGDLVIPHGLSYTPTMAVVTPMSSNCTQGYVTTLDATNVTFRCYSPTGVAVNAGSVTVTLMAA